MTNADVVMGCFTAVERRDERRQQELFHPDAEFHWPPSLKADWGSWQEAWDPFQPSEAERRLDPRVVAAQGDEVVVLWTQRGVDAAGERFECPVLRLYEVRDGRLARAQMFYFDTTAARRFLRRAARRAGRR